MEVRRHPSAQEVKEMVELLLVSLEPSTEARVAVEQQLSAMLRTEPGFWRGVGEAPLRTLHALKVCLVIMTGEDVGTVHVRMMAAILAKNVVRGIGMQWEDGMHEAGASVNADAVQSLEHAVEMMREMDLVRTAARPRHVVRAIANVLCALINNFEGGFLQRAWPTLWSELTEVAGEDVATGKGTALPLVVLELLLEEWDDDASLAQETLQGLIDVYLEVLSQASALEHVPDLVFEALCTGYDSAVWPVLAQEQSALDATATVLLRGLVAREPGRVVEMGHEKAAVLEFLATYDEAAVRDWVITLMQQTDPEEIPVLSWLASASPNVLDSIASECAQFLVTGTAAEMSYNDHALVHADDDGDVQRALETPPEEVSDEYDPNNELMTRLSLMSEIVRESSRVGEQLCAEAPGAAWTHCIRALNGEREQVERFLVEIDPPASSLSVCMIILLAKNAQSACLEPQHARQLVRVLLPCTALQGLQVQACFALREWLELSVERDFAAADELRMCKADLQHSEALQGWADRIAREALLVQKVTLLRGVQSGELGRMSFARNSAFDVNVLREVFDFC